MTPCSSEYLQSKDPSRTRPTPIITAAEEAETGGCRFQTSLSYITAPYLQSKILRWTHEINDYSRLERGTSPVCPSGHPELRVCVHRHHPGLERAEVRIRSVSQGCVRSTSNHQREFPISHWAHVLTVPTRESERFLCFCRLFLL